MRQEAEQSDKARKRPYMAVSVPLSTPEALRPLFGRLVDREGMRDRLQQSLSEVASVPIRVMECKARPARHRETLKSARVHIGYTVTIEAAGGGRSVHTILGTAPVTPAFLEGELGDRCREAEGHPALAPLRRASVYLEDLQMALVVFPVDPALPALADLTRPEGGDLLARYVPECRQGAQLQGIDAKLRVYKPGVRAVLRIEATFARPAGRRAVFAKVFSDERGAANYQDQLALWDLAQRSRCFRIAEPLGYDPPARTLIMAEAPGGRALTEWIKCIEKGRPLPEGVDLDRLRGAVLVAAEALVELQRSDLSPRQTRTFSDELANLRRDFERIRPRVGPCAPDLEALLGRLEACAPDQEPLVPAHGGFRHKQTVGDERALTVIDWDGLALASPALDPATFIRRLLQEPLRRPGSAPQMLDLAAGFRAAFLARRPEVAARQLDLYEAVSITESAIRAFSRPKHQQFVLGEMHNVLALAGRLVEGWSAPWHAQH